MSRAGILERLDDRLNPIVVKELRQAVQGRFVTTILLIFLFLQLIVLGGYLILAEVGAGASDLEAQHGRTVFSILQGVLLVTCMIFLPLYTGIRLGAERSDTNVDLLFITTLRPRAIISGKLAAGLVLALVIFSACAPFMTFTYLLRGLDLFSILLVLGIDFFVVIVTVQLAIFLGALPGNRIFKALLGMAALGALLLTCYGTVVVTVMLLLQASTASMVDDPNFWAVLSCGAATGLTLIGLFFTWSVAMISPPSANRALPSRLFLCVAWLGTAAVFGFWNYQLPMGPGGPLMLWIIFMGSLCGLQLVIAVNEREHWTPRVARTIPRHWWLRPPAFLVYSGSAGGVLLAALLFGLTWAAVQAGKEMYLARSGSSFAWTRTLDLCQTTLEVVGMVLLHIYAYALTAVLLRRISPIRVRTVDTWVVVIFLLAVGCTGPLLISYILAWGRPWRFDDQYYWLVTNPIVAGSIVGEHSRYRLLFWAVPGIWAGVVTLLNVSWFVRQMVGFRPFVGGTAPLQVVPVLTAAEAMDVTKTAP
jgi:hypothetical protein